MATNERNFEDWLTSSRKAIDALREVRQMDIGTPVIPQDMRREMEAFMRRVEDENKPAGT